MKSDSGEPGPGKTFYLSCDFENKKKTPELRYVWSTLHKSFYKHQVYINALSMLSE